MPARKVLLLGATGATGRHVLEQALGRKLDVTVLVRSPERLAGLTHGARVVTGDILGDTSCLGNAVTGQDAVISTLGAWPEIQPQRWHRARCETLRAAWRGHRPTRRGRREERWRRKRRLVHERASRLQLMRRSSFGGMRNG